MNIEMNGKERRKDFKNKNKVYLPGPAALTDIISTNHPAEDGLVGGITAPVGCDTKSQNITVTHNQQHYYLKITV